MIQDLVEYDKPYGGYVGALGQQNMDIIEVTRDVSLYEFGIIIEVATDEKERQTLELDMRAAIENKELRPEDAAVARSIGNTKLANQYMLLKRKEYIAEQLRQSRENAEANAQQQAASAQAAAQAEIQKEAQVSKIRMQEEQNKKDLEARLEQVRHKLKMEEIRLQNEGDVDVAQVNEREKTA